MKMQIHIISFLDYVTQFILGQENASGSYRGGLILLRLL